MSNISIKEIKLKKHMSKEEVNALTGRRIILLDEVYLGNTYYHNWMCKCGNLTKRMWSKIRESKENLCESCRYEEVENRYLSMFENEKDYKYIRSYRRGEKTTDKGFVIDNYPYIRVKHLYCNSEYDIRAKEFKKGIRCAKCCGSYEKSFAYNIEQELGLDINDIWDFEKNTVNPYHIGKSSNIKVWIKCLEKEYHGSYETSCTSFYAGSRCGFCNTRTGKIHPKDSFAQYHIDNTDTHFLEKYWNWEKNNELGISPWEVSPSSLKKIWVKCTNKEVNRRNNMEKKDYHGSYLVTCDKFTQGGRCKKCNPYNPSNIHVYDSVGYSFPEVAEMIMGNSKREKVDTFKVMPCSNKKYYFKCKHCGKEGSKSKSLQSVIKGGYSCEYCSDGVSIPQKFMANLLKELRVSYEVEKSFDWSQGKRYDFYIPSLNMIIETHGIQHYKYTSKKFKSLKEQQENDKFKKDIALENGILNYIEVDCRYSKKNWLIDNSIASLEKYFTLSNVDWDKIWIKSLSSKVIESWKLYKEGLDKKEISAELGVSIYTVRAYLKRGEELNII